MTPSEVDVRLQVNGTRHDLTLDVRTTLLDALREHLDLTGSKKGCDHGQCGACTVFVDGRRTNACLLFAVAVQDREVVTVEGVAGLGGPARTPGDLHPVQQAFLDHDAFQCGYCTPGQVCSAIGTLDEIAAGIPSAATGGSTPELDAAEVRERMSGNLCRCGAYANIVPAVLAAGGAR